MSIQISPASPRPISSPMLQFLLFVRGLKKVLPISRRRSIVEQQKGRPAALDYMALHGSALEEIESPSTPRSDSEASDSLVNTTNEELYRSKAMCVWWMLRDMVGDAALKKAMARLPSRAG